MNPPGFRALKVSLGQVNLDAALRCGQSFRWTRHSLPHTVENGETEWRYCARDRVLCLRQTPSHIFYKAVFPDGLQTSERDTDTAAWLHDYLQLNTDLEALYTTWAESDPVFASLRHRFKGIRMLRQDPWETLVSFICSSNNQISRITSMVQNLSTHFCPPLLTLPDPNEPSKTLSYHSFPHPSMLAAPSVSSKLRALGFGYRAEFIQRTAKMLVDLHGSDRAAGDLQEPAEKWLLTLRDMETAVARQELLKFVGVGRKVADCIALMALDKHEVIPVDTHVQQIAVKHYKLKGIKAKTAMSPKLYEEVATRLTAVWGEYAGWAHSVLFTADLKAFTTYGLEASESISIQTEGQAGVLKTSIEAMLPTPPATPASSPVKRKNRADDDFHDPTASRTRSKRRRATDEETMDSRLGANFV